MDNPTQDSGATLSDKIIRGEVLVDGCPSRSILEHVTSRWGVLAIVALAKGVYRFSELRRKVGANERMLAQTLQRLEADGLVLRVSHPVVPPHVEYSLTPLGQQLAPRVEALVDWIEINLQPILTAQHQYAQRNSRKSGSETAIFSANSER